MSCSICSSPREVLVLVNEALGRREPLRSLASKTGISRASLSRHNRKCLVREQLASFRAQKLQLEGRRLLVCWPDAQIIDFPRGTEIPPCEISDADFLLNVEFVSGEVKNPAALLSTATLAADAPDAASRPVV